GPRSRLMPHRPLAAEAFHLIGAPSLLGPLVSWLQQAGLPADRIASYETPGDLPPPESTDDESICIVTAAEFLPAVRQRPALLGGWNLPVSTVEPAPHFFWSGD